MTLIGFEIMNDEDFTELDKLFAENARMKKALTDIASAPTAFAMNRNTYSKKNIGLISGLKAASNIALLALKEPHGPEDSKAATSTQED
jgi:hypothetical protein